MTGYPPLLVGDRDGHVAVIRRGTGAAWDHREELAHHGRWPTWSPDRSLVARSTIVPTGDTETAVISAVSLDGMERSVLHEGSPGEQAMIAPNIPHYMLWAPTSDALSYVAATEQGLSLFLSTVDQIVRSHRISVGAPLFHSWSPDGRRIVLHAGTDVALFDRASLALIEVAQGAYGFRTPRFSPDGSCFLYAIPSGDGVSLVKQQTDGAARQIGQFQGGVSFSWANDQFVFVAVARGSDGDGFQGLWLVDAETETREPVAAGPFVACWPSPAGDRVALVVPTQIGDGRFTLQVRDRSGRRLAASEPLLFSDDFRTMVTFFDQYELSHPVWAADGCGLVVCGRLGNDAVSGSWGDPDGDYVFSWDAVRGSPLSIAGPGGLASFPPPRGMSSK